MNRLLRLLLVLLFSVGVLHADEEWNLDRLMAKLAENPGGTVAFTERHYLDILDDVVESSGTMVYQRPGRLERHIEHPKAESMVLDGNHITLDRESSHMQLELDSYPQLAGMVGSIRSALAGDRSALERDYRLELHGKRHEWRLDLIPRHYALQRYVSRILISGHDGRVSTFEIDQADGDRTVTTIEPIKP